MDGNNSLKRIHSAARGHVELPDSRHILSDRWLSAAQVNKFSNEVNGNAVCAFSLILRHHLASFSSLTMETSLWKKNPLMTQIRKRPNAVTDGGMQALSPANKCSHYLMKQACSSPVAVTAPYCMCAT